MYKIDNIMNSETSSSYFFYEIQGLLNVCPALFSIKFIVFIQNSDETQVDDQIVFTVNMHRFFA